MKRSHVLAVVFISLFVIGLIPFGFSQATTSYATDGGDGSTVSASQDPFSDYDFNETYPKADESGITWSYQYMLFGGATSSDSVSNTYTSDDVRVNIYCDSVTQDKGAEFYFSVSLSSGQSFKVMFEGYEDKPASSCYLQIYDYSSSSWVDVITIPTSESQSETVLTNTGGKYVSSGLLKLRVKNFPIGDTGYIRVDYFVIKPQDSDGNYMTIWEEDFSEISEWSVYDTNGAHSTDGDILTIGATDGIYAIKVTAIRFSTDNWPYLEIGFNGGNQNFQIHLKDTSDSNYYTGIESVSDTKIYRYNVRALCGSVTIKQISIYVYGTSGESRFDYVRFYKMQDYGYGGSSVNKGAVAYNDGSKLVMQIAPDDSGDEYWRLEIDVTDFETNTYKYFVYQAVEDSSEANGYFKITYNDSSTDWPSFDTTNTTRTFDLDANKKVDKITIYINDNPNSLDSGEYYCYIYFMTFSVAEIDVDSITVNFEDTWLSPDQSIEITSIIAKWSDGTTISQNNFKVDFWENSTIQQSNTSATISRTVQLYNSTYMLGISWCNDTRYRFWVVGSNYSFWIVGSNMSIGFEYDWNIIDSGGFLGVYYQSIQASWDNNNSVVSEQPTFYWWSNSTSKGYAQLPTTGWIADFKYQISEGSSAEWVNVWINATNGDWWQIVYNTTVNVIDLAYTIEFNAISWSESESEINAFIEISGGGYLKAYENYSNLVAPLQSDGTIKWSKATALGRVRVDIMCSKFSDFRSYANVTFYYDVERILVYVRYYWSGDNTTSLDFHDFHLYVNSEFQIFEPFFVDSSTNLNITVNDRLENTLFQVTNYNLTGVDNGIALIEITLTYYNLYIQNSGYEPIYVDLYCGDIKLPERIVIPAQATWGAIKVYNTSYSYIAYHKGADDNTYEVFKEGDFTVSQSDYRLDLSSKSEVDVPDYPNYGGFNWDKFVVLLGIALAIATVIIIIAIAISTSRAKAKKNDKKKQKVDLSSIFVKEWEKERKKEWEKVR